MTRFDPNLSLRRMVIERSGRPVYDERFHPGVNIVRGENSSGKSTILNFIHYGLGGDVSEWSEMALLCERVTVEVLLNGKLATLSRLVAEKEQQPMEIFFGSFADSLKADRAQWERFPYRRSQVKESFSQVIFRLLEIPEAANEDSGNITMHQVMRLLYADQLSPIDQILPPERWDNERIREAIGKLLCGAFESELYSNDLEMRATEKRHNLVQAELNSLYKTLGHAEHDLTPAWLIEQRARNEDERRRIGEEIALVQRETLSQRRDAPTLVAQERAYEALVEAQRTLAQRRRERDANEVSIADSAAFIRSLEEKLIALKDSELVAQELGAPQFSSCPACYAELQEATEGICVLCKEPYNSDIAAERIGGIINDTALQLRQSRLLQEERAARLADADAALATAEAEWGVAARRYAEIQARPTNEQEIRLSDLYKRLGYLDRQDEDLTEKARMIELIASLASQKAELNDRLGRLKDRNEQLRMIQQGRLDDAYLAISENVRALLSRDLKRQDSFENPQKVDFSFSDNKISVDGHTYFSASSRAILKSAFFLGFHAAATQKDYFRHPRFVMLDTVEDKGMEAPRSHNFQRLIVEVSESSVTENQIIFGTAMIAEELNNEAYTVGRFYTRDNRSLDFQ